MRINYLSVIGRSFLAALFLLSGVSKLTTAETTIHYIETAGLPFASFLYVMTLIVEIGGGLLLLVGYQARMVAAILSLFTIAAAFFFHLNFSDQNQLVHFIKNIAIAGGLIQIVCFGAGKGSIDDYHANASSRSLFLSSGGVLR